jgi:hypothetical protein
LLSVFIQTPAMALSKISLCSMMPKPPLYTKMPPFWPPQILLRWIRGLLPVLEGMEKKNVWAYRQIDSTWDNFRQGRENKSWRLKPYR